MARRIVQIENTTIRRIEHKKTFEGGEPYCEEYECQNVLTALCDDGTVWYYDCDQWKKLNPIPSK